MQFARSVAPFTGGNPGRPDERRAGQLGEVRTPRAVSSVDVLIGQPVEVTAERRRPHSRRILGVSVGIEDLVENGTRRPAVEQDVLERHRKLPLVDTVLDECEANERRRLEVERHSTFLGEKFRRTDAEIAPLRQSDDPDRCVGDRRDDLRFAGRQERRTKIGIAPEHCANRRHQSVRIEGADDALRHLRHVRVVPARFTGSDHVEQQALLKR